MDLPVDQIFELLKAEPGSGLLHSILLILIWLNVRSLKNSLVEQFASHDKRITTLELDNEKNKTRLTALEPKGNL